MNGKLSAIFAFSLFALVLLSGCAGTGSPNGGNGAVNGSINASSNGVVSLTLDVYSENATTPWKEWHASQPVYKCGGNTKCIEPPEQIIKSYYKEVYGIEIKEVTIAHFQCGPSSQCLGGGYRAEIKVNAKDAGQFKKDGWKETEDSGSVNTTNVSPKYDSESNATVNQNESAVTLEACDLKERGIDNTSSFFLDDQFLGCSGPFGPRVFMQVNKLDGGSGATTGYVDVTLYPVKEYSFLLNKDDPCGNWHNETMNISEGYSLRVIKTFYDYDKNKYAATFQLIEDASSNVLVEKNASENEELNYTLPNGKEVKLLFLLPMMNPGSSCSERFVDVSVIGNDTQTRLVAGQDVFRYEGYSVALESVSREPEGLVGFVNVTRPT